MNRRSFRENRRFLTERAKLEPNYLEALAAARSVRKRLHDLPGAVADLSAARSPCPPVCDAYLLQRRLLVD